MICLEHKSSDRPIDADANDLDSVCNLPMSNSRLADSMTIPRFSATAGHCWSRDHGSRVLLLQADFDGEFDVSDIAVLIEHLRGVRSADCRQRERSRTLLRSLPRG